MVWNWGRGARRGFTALAAATLLTVPGLGTGSAFADELLAGSTIVPSAAAEVDQSVPGDDETIAKREREQRGNDDGAGHAFTIHMETPTLARREREQRGNDDGPGHALTVSSDTLLVARREREQRGNDDGPGHH